MGDSQHPIDPAAVGIWVLDDTGKRLEHRSEEQLTQSSRELDDSISLDHPSTQTIAEYFTHLSPTQKKIYDDLQGLGWEDAGIHNLLTLLENTRKHHCARLRMRGTSETEIERLCTLCDQGITDYSSLSRPLATPADEDYQVQLYLLNEVPRQKRVMLGEKSIPTSRSEVVTANSSPPKVSTDRRASHQKNDERETTADTVTVHDGVNKGIVFSDLWSAAYREAVENFKEEMDISILEGRSIAQLFEDLEEVGKDATNESAFIRGVKYLRSLQVPLERFRLALDVASPLANMEPTATVVVGVVRSVTAIAISFASADLDFAKQIAEMLEQIQYIDDCDTLGQKADRKDIHKALVSVYEKILEFYKAALDILSRKGAKFVMKMVLETDRLPNIVQDFLKCSDHLRKVVEKAILDVSDDIRSMFYDREIDLWLGSDTMRRQSQYHATLQELRADRACEFLLDNPRFLDWYRHPEPSQLVILGDLGRGKTVAMSFLVDRLSRKNACQLPQPKICWYYCRNDDSGKATTIFSALILSLLKQLPGLKKPFVQWYKDSQASGIFDPAANPQMLEGFLQRALESIDRLVFIVVDGLDECDTASRNSLLKSLKALSQKNFNLKVLVSSRPGEEILEQLGGMARVELGPDAHRDGIIVNSAVEKQLSYLSPDAKALVINKLTHLAQGSAIWTKMIISLVEIRKIRALDPIRSFLDDMPLPEQLSELYVTLFSRCTSDDPENQALATAGLKLLAATHRPLNILELAWAVTLSVAEHVTTLDALSKLVDPQRVLSLIHPFIIRVDFGDPKKRQVRLTHESAKEFIIEKWTLPKQDVRGSSLCGTVTKKLDQRSEILEEFAMNVCIRYLLLDEIGVLNLFTEWQVAISELPQESDLWGDEQSAEYDPYCSWDTWEEDMIRFDPAERGFGEFFVYASSYWLEHSSTLSAEHLPSRADTEAVCQAGSTRLKNWTQQNCRPGCAISARFEFDSELYDALSITALYGSVDMLRDLLDNSDFGRDRFLEESVMKAADQVLQWGDLSRLKAMFFNDRVGHELHNSEFFMLVTKNWRDATISRNDWHHAFDLIDHMSDKTAQGQWGNEVLCAAASLGCMPLICRLMTRAQHNEELRHELLRECEAPLEKQAFEEPAHQSIGEAVWGNHLKVVEFLLKENGIEAHLRYRDSCGRNVLHLASKYCNPEMYRLLVPRFREGVHQVDHQGDTPLVRIVKSSSFTKNRYDSLTVLLINSGFDRVANLKERRNPLQAAVQLGDRDMCCFLICFGKISPLSLVSSDSPSQNGSIEASSGEETNMLHELGELLGVEEDEVAKRWTAGSRMEEAILLLARRHYQDCFWDSLRES